MKIYLAGNFVQMKYIKDEEEAIEKVINELGTDYNRLLSFYYKVPWTDNVLNLMRKMQYENK